MKKIFIGCIIFILLTQIGIASTEIMSKKDQKSIVMVHNMYRNPLKLKKLEWSNDLAVNAENWATMLENNACPLTHSPAELRNNYGENLYAGWSSNPSYHISLRKGVYAWGKEKKYYQYSGNTCAPNAVCGHYTQMVWKNTEHIGCAVARCTTSSQTTEILVCQYDPPGNYVGELPY